MSNAEIEIFQSEDGNTEVSVRLEKETVWLNQYQMEELFETDRTSIVKQISNIYKSKELDEESTSAKIALVRKEGSRQITRKILFYNLDLIITVGYRVNSKRGTQFRIWANKVLKEYLLKGYALNEKRLAQHNEQLKELKESVKILGNVLKKKELSNDESNGLLIKIIKTHNYLYNIKLILYICTGLVFK